MVIIYTSISPAHRLVLEIHNKNNKRSLLQRINILNAKDETSDRYKHQKRPCSLATMYVA